MHTTLPDTMDLALRLMDFFSAYLSYSTLHAQYARSFIKDGTGLWSACCMHSAAAGSLKPRGPECLLLP